MIVEVHMMSHLDLGWVRSCLRKSSSGRAPVDSVRACDACPVSSVECRGALFYSPWLRWRVRLVLWCWRVSFFVLQRLRVVGLSPTRRPYRPNLWMGEQSPARPHRPLWALSINPRSATLTMIMSHDQNIQCSIFSSN